ncbi:MAG TPA: fluoride efflux transporter CrcB [Thermoanaerobaculia bacterium]|jgi:CrcB protein
MVRFLWICAGGAIGTGARYLISGWAARRFGASFPFGTLAVNLIGCFLIGAIMHVALTTAIVSPGLRVVLAVGVMGGFTTYSGFNFETLQYLREGAWLLGISNAVVMVGTCLAAGVAGLVSARWLVGN